MADRRARGRLLAALGILLVSTDSLFIRIADVDSWTMAVIVGSSSSLVAGTAFVGTARRSMAATVRWAPRVLVLIAALQGAGQLAFTVAVNNTAVSNVVVIVGTMPVVAGVLARVLLGEHTHPRVMVAMAGTVAGVLVVVGGSVGAPMVAGDLASVAAIVSVSLSVVLLRAQPDVNRPLAVMFSSALMAAVALPFADIAGAPPKAWIAGCLMGAVFNPVGRFCYMTAPRYAPVSEVASFTPVETVAASVWAWAAFSEVPSTATFLGGVIVIAAVLFGVARAPSTASAGVLPETRSLRSRVAGGTEER